MHSAIFHDAIFHNLCCSRWHGGKEARKPAAHNRENGK